MNIRTFIVIIAILLLLPSQAFSSDLGSLRISLIEGDAQVKLAESDDWVPLAINTPLRDGDSIWVPDDGRLEINLRDGTFVRLDENSSLDILTAENNSFQFYLSQGHAYINFRGARDGVMQMDTPVSSLRAYDKTKFLVDVTDNGRTEVAVLKGLVYAESRSGQTRVNSGRVLAISEYGEADLYALGPADAWERWNRDRDSRYEERSYASSRYLPDELDSYAYDFDDNGRWVQVREYGYVWTPTVYISAGWSPYRHGRWIWVGSDYVWVPYEPWGWAPYHYGRWAFVASVGWCWVPPARGSVYWGPGYVGWVHTPGYVAWVPLAPGDIYYGYGHYGPNSVNIININIQKTVIKHEYKNVHVRDSVVALHQDTFRTGKRVEFKPKDNPFLRKDAAFGRPAAATGRASIMPVIKEIPQAKQPPKQVREVRIPDLKRERPLAREKTIAVISREPVQKSMPVREVQEQRQRQFKSSVGPAVTQRQTQAEDQRKTEAAKRPESVRETRDIIKKTPESRTESGREPAVRLHDPKKSQVEKPSERAKEPVGKRVITPRESSAPAASREQKKSFESSRIAPPPSPGKSSMETTPERSFETREVPSSRKLLPQTETRVTTRQDTRIERRETPAPVIQPKADPPAPQAAPLPAQKAEKPRKERSEKKAADDPGAIDIGRGLRGMGGR